MRKSLNNSKFKILDNTQCIKGGCDDKDKKIPPYDDHLMKPDGMVVVIILPVPDGD